MVAIALLVILSADDLTKRLENGEVIVEAITVEGSTVPRAKMQAVIEAAPEKVWAIVDDCGSYAKTMPRIAASKQLTREANTVTCEVTADLPFPISDLTAQTQATITVEPGVKWERAWKMLKGDYVTNTGSWVLVPFKGDPKRTLATYQIHAEPKIALPQAIINSAQRTSLPKVIERLREQTVGK